MLVMGDADMVVAGGVESFIDAVPIASFAMMRAMSTNNDNPAAASRPFDKDRDGFVFGEAGALMILETEEHAKARGATIHARLLGSGITSDGYHIVAPHPEGLGAARAMTRAIEMAGLTKSDIKHINAHATATPIGDIAEAKAINAAVGNHAAVYGPKSALGHSIGAVGALESVLTVLAVRDGIIPPTLNVDSQDPEIDLDVVKGEPRTGSFDFALNNSFGFGGHNVALAFGRGLARTAVCICPRVSLQHNVTRGQHRPFVPPKARTEGGRDDHPGPRDKVRIIDRPARSSCAPGKSVRPRHNNAAPRP